MEDLQELHDLQNKEKEKLQEKNKVSFDEYETEIVDSSIKKKLIKLENHAVKKLYTYYQRKKNYRKT